MSLLQQLIKSVVNFLRFILLILLWIFILINRSLEIKLYTIELCFNKIVSKFKHFFFIIWFYISNWLNVVKCASIWILNALEHKRIKLLVYKYQKTQKQKYKQEVYENWKKDLFEEVIPNKFRELLRFMYIKEKSIIDNYTLYIKDKFSFKVYYFGLLLRMLLRMYYSEFERFILYIHVKKFNVTIVECCLVYYLYSYYFWPCVIVLIIYELRMFYFVFEFFVLDQGYARAAARDGKQKYGHKWWFNFAINFGKKWMPKFEKWNRIRFEVALWLHYFYVVLIILCKVKTLFHLLGWVMVSPVRWAWKLIKFIVSTAVFHFVKFYKTTPFEKIFIKTAFDLERKYYVKLNEYIDLRAAWKMLFEDVQEDYQIWYVYTCVTLEKNLDETLMDLWVLGWWVKYNIFLSWHTKKVIVRVFIADIRRICLLYYYFGFLWQIFLLKTQFLWFYETVLDFPFYIIVLTWIHYWDFFKVSMIIEAFLFTEFYILYLSYRYKEVPITIIDSLLISRYLIWGEYKVEILKLKMQLFLRYPFCEIYWVRIQICFWRLVVVWLKFTQVVYIIGRVLLNIIDLLTLGGLSYLKLWIMDRYWTEFFYYYINGHKKK